MMEQVTRRSRHDWRRLGWGAIGVIGTVMLSLPGMAQFPPTAPIFEQVTLSPGLDFIDDPIVLEGISGGSIPARQVAGRLDTPTGACLGFVERAPDHVLTLTDFFDYLSLRVCRDGEQWRLQIAGRHQPHQTPRGAGGQLVQ